ncbi:hypothetical protein OPQ81_001056 [Rhizoctonia solani]|nr:hypothetical protein OPQ81_001056 [Rhizoctonia solani]
MLFYNRSGYSHCWQSHIMVGTRRASFRPQLFGRRHRRRTHDGTWFQLTTNPRKVFPPLEPLSHFFLKLCWNHLACTPWHPLGT